MIKPGCAEHYVIHVLKNDPAFVPELDFVMEKDVTGVYQTPQGYYVKDEEVDEFDKGFPAKEKLKLHGQIFG